MVKYVQGLRFCVSGSPLLVVRNIASNVYQIIENVLYKQNRRNEMIIITISSLNCNLNLQFRIFYSFHSSFQKLYSHYLIAFNHSSIFLIFHFLSYINNSIFIKLNQNKNNFLYPLIPNQMLPLLKKTNHQQFQASQIKLYNPPRELANFQFDNQRKSSMMSSSRANNKIRVMAGGFRKDDPTYQTMKNNMAVHKSLQEPTYATLSMQNVQKNPFVKLQGNSNLSAQIKLIEKKIRFHKKKLQQEKKKKEQVQRAKNDPYSNDFQKIIQRQMELQGYPAGQINQPKGFDYLTNPGKVNQEEEVVQETQPEPIIIPQPKKFEITQKIEKLQRHYEQSLKKKFERRQMFPHYPCKRKTPKLYVTAKTNALQKFGKKPDQQQHMFRVMTKECTPQQIYPTIPAFAIVKDNLSRNVIAYLSDFKPFIEKTKEEQEQQENQQSQQNDIRVKTSDEGHRNQNKMSNTTSNINPQDKNRS